MQDTNHSGKISLGLGDGRRVTGDAGRDDPDRGFLAHKPGLAGLANGLSRRTTRLVLDWQAKCCEGAGIFAWRPAVMAAWSILVDG